MPGLVDRQAGSVEFSWTPAAYSFGEILQATGAVPLPPYIKRNAEASDAERYQTVYSHVEGAVAAPTAGLHFTNDILEKVRSRGILTDFLTLHVSAGTFMPCERKKCP
ncbi:MAG: S-adenosylmethionine:tRNA ribosyltransferase-isomerase [Bacteroidota bacterium]